MPSIFTLQNVADLERRCHAAEARHQELTGQLAEATRPLLRQIEAQQAASTAAAQAWAAVERSLQQRLAEATAAAAAAVQRERAATEQCQAAQVCTLLVDAQLFQRHCFAVDARSVDCSIDWLAAHCLEV